MPGLLLVVGEQEIGKAKRKTAA